MSNQRTAVTSGLTALAPAVWGSTYLVTTEFLPPDRPLLVSTVRALPAGLILLLATRVLPKGIWWWRAVALGVLNIGAFFYFLFLAAYHLPGGVAALIMSVQPMIVLLLGSLLLREKVQPVHVVSCLLAAGGVALLVLQPQAGLDRIGVVAGLLGALSMACGIVLTKRWGRPESVTLLTFTGWQLTVGGIVLLPITVASEPPPYHLTWGNIGGFAYLGVIGALIAYALWFRGLSRLPALTASFLTFASPLCATILGCLFLDESLRPLQLLGAACVIGAVILAQPRNKPRGGRNARRFQNPVRPTRRFTVWAGQSRAADAPLLPGGGLPGRVSRPTGPTPFATCGRRDRCGCCPGPVGDGFVAVIDGIPGRPGSGVAE